MSTYILIHNPSRPNVPGVQENPAQEIADNIRAGNFATTIFGGWSIGTNKLKMKPGSCLLFYRSEVEPRGFFAVGRVLPAEDFDCRQLRQKALQHWYPDRLAADYELGGAIEPGLAAYEGPSWHGEGDKTVHINAKWDVVADPEKRLVLVQRDTNDIGVVRASGFHIPEDKADIADDICAKCMTATNALHAR